MLKRLGPLTKFLLGMAGILILLAVTAGLWWWLPAWPRARLTSDHGPCQLIHFPENSNNFAAVHPNQVAVWDVAGKRLLGVTPFRGQLVVHWSPDGETLAIAEKSNLGPPLWDSVQLWRPATQSAPAAQLGHVATPEFTADGRFLILWTGEKHQLWDIAGNREQPFPVRFKHVDGIGSLQDGRIVVSDYHYEDGWLVQPIATKLWTFTPELKLACGPITLRGISGPIRISPDGRRFTAWKMDWEPNVIKLFELDSGREVASFVSGFKGGAVPTPEFSPDSARLITDDTTLWDISSMPPRQIGSLEGKLVRFSPDGKWLASMHIPGFLSPVHEAWEFHHAATLQPTGVKMETPDGPTFCPQGNTIATMDYVAPSAFGEFLSRWIPGASAGSSGASVRVWQLPDWREGASLPDARCFAYLPDGKAMAVGHKDGSIDIWDIPPRRPWWIEYGLAVLFALLVLLGARFIWLAFRRSRPERLPSNETLG